MLGTCNISSIRTGFALLPHPLAQKDAVPLVRIRYASTVLLAFAAILFTSAAQAMEIRQFDKMAGQDQSDYIVALIEGAQKVLIDEGKHDLAAKTHKLFTEVPPGDDMPIGMTAFVRNLARARLADAERVEKDHNARRLEVEHAMLVTLKKNDIVLPKSFMTVMKDFKPKHPPKEKQK